VIDAAPRAAPADRQEVRVQHPCRSEVVPGKHTVVVEKPGMQDYESDLVVNARRDTSRFSSHRQPRTRLDGGDHRRRADRRWRVVGQLSVKNGRGQADIASGQLIDNGDPRYDRAKLQAIGADVLFGLGAIVGSRRRSVS